MEISFKGFAITMGVVAMLILLAVAFLWLFKYFALALNVCMMLILIQVIFRGFMKGGNPGMYIVLFVNFGLIMWQFLTESKNRPLGIITWGLSGICVAWLASLLYYVFLRAHESRILVPLYAAMLLTAFLDVLIMHYVMRMPPRGEWLVRLPKKDPWEGWD